MSFCVLLSQEDKSGPSLHQKKHGYLLNLCVLNNNNNNDYTCAAHAMITMEEIKKMHNLAQMIT